MAFLAGRTWFRRHWGRWRWPVVDAVVVDKRHLKKVDFRSESIRTKVSFDEYLIEVPGPAGHRSHVRICEDDVALPDKLKYGVEVRGASVRVHLNAAGTKAAFAKDYRERTAHRKQRERSRRARDDKRFRSTEGR